MNEIYNNLNIEDLTKTDSYKDFNKAQKEEIKIGILVGLDIYVYAKTEFNAYQMHQIRLGLEENLDVSIYAKIDFNDFQMSEIRLGLEKKLRCFDLC